MVRLFIQFPRGANEKFIRQELGQWGWAGRGGEGRVGSGVGNCRGNDFHGLDRFARVVGTEEC